MYFYCAFETVSLQSNYHPKIAFINIEKHHFDLPVFDKITIYQMLNKISQDMFSGF